MTASVTPVAKPAASVLADIQTALTDAGGDAEKAVTNVKALFTDAETSAPVNAVKSFVGTVLKSGRGGACVALVAAAPAAFFLGPMSGLYMLAVAVVLIATSPGAVSMLTSDTKGEPGWAIALAVLVAGFAGAGLLWAANHGAVAIVGKLF